MTDRILYFKLPGGEPLVVPPGNPVHRPVGGGPTAPATPLFSGGGFDPYGTDRIPLGARTVSIQARFVGTAASRQAEINTWRAAANQRGRVFSYSALDVVVWQWARLAMPDPETRWDSPNFTEITLTWMIYGDGWNGLRHGLGIELDTDPPTGFDEGLVLDYDASQWDTGFQLPDHATYTTETITHGGSLAGPLPLSNGGTLPQTAVTVTITAGFVDPIDGSDGEPIVLNINGYTCGFRRPIASNQKLIINSGNSSVTLASELFDNYVEGDTILGVEVNDSWVVGQLVSIDLDNGTTHETRLSAVNVDGNHITIVHPLPAAASQHNLVRVGVYEYFTEPAYRMEWIVLEPDIAGLAVNTLSLTYSGGGVGGTTLLEFSYYDNHA